MTTVFLLMVGMALTVDSVYGAKEDCERQAMVFKAVTEKPAICVEWPVIGQR